MKNFYEYLKEASSEAKMWQNHGHMGLNAFALSEGDKVKTAVLTMVCDKHITLYGWGESVIISELDSQFPSFERALIALSAGLTEEAQAKRAVREKNKEKGYPSLCNIYGRRIRFPKKRTTKRLTCKG